MRIRKCLCLSMGLLLALGMTMALNVSAKSYEGDDGWLVNYTGSRLESNLDTSNMTEALQDMQPGDSVHLTVALKNSASSTMNFYMTNEVIRSLEDGNDASGGAYTYQLTYLDPQGKKNVIYDSSLTGDAGLHQIDNGKNSYYYLDELSQGASGTVDLTITLDGETQGNSYQGALAQMQMNFAVEQAVTTGGSSSSSSHHHHSSGSSSSTETTIPQILATLVPQTGDTAHLLLLSLLALISGGVLLFWGVIWIRRDRRNREVQK